MSKEILIDVGIGKKSNTYVDVNTNKKSNTSVDVGINASNTIPASGSPGQVLTKTNTRYKWEDNPIQVNTYEDLPTNPSEHCLYLITDIAKLVYWDSNSWVMISSSSDLLYDEEEEMMYLG